MNMPPPPPRAAGEAVPGLPPLGCPKCRHLPNGCGYCRKRRERAAARAWAEQLAAEQPGPAVPGAPLPAIAEEDPKSEREEDGEAQEAEEEAVPMDPEAMLPDFSDDEVLEWAPKNSLHHGQGASDCGGVGMGVVLFDQHVLATWHST